MEASKHFHKINRYGIYIPFLKRKFFLDPIEPKLFRDVMSSNIFKLIIGVLFCYLSVTDSFPKRKFFPDPTESKLSQDVMTSAAPSYATVQPPVISQKPLSQHRKMLIKPGRFCMVIVLDFAPLSI